MRYFAGVRRIVVFCCLLIAGLFSVSGVPCVAAASSAPALDATELRNPRALDMTWLIQPGDDPAYAAPGFDDSQWRRFDPHTSIVPLYGSNRPSVVWYRMHIKVDPADPGMGISELQISRAFEIYANGERIIACGSVAPFRSYTSTARIVAHIPQRLLKSGTLVLALRVHIANSEWGNTGNPGYYADNLILGEYDTLYKEKWLTLIGEHAVGWLDRFLLIGLGFVALVLFLAQRRETEYLWIAAVGAINLIEWPEPLIAAFRNIPTHWEILSDIPRVATPYIWASLYFSFVHRKVTRGWRIFLIIAGVLNAVSAMQGVLFASALPFQLLGNLPFIILLSLIIPVVLAIDWRRGNPEAGILLLPAVLFGLYIYAQIAMALLYQFTGWKEAALRGFTLMQRYTAGPFVIPFEYVVSMMSTIALAIIILQRSSTTARKQALFESEMEAAKQVQQVLIPDQNASVPGFAVDSVYLPAQQVGGDFYQVLPDGKGGLLLVVGDVAGKGLPAAMLVSVIVGALRATAEYTTSPSELLRSLNDRLVGRAGGAFSTALIAHVSPEGAVRLANAGHPSPYLDGGEIETDGALPLGIMADLRYAEMEFSIAPGSRLTFYSDGVIEAQGRDGELFGFERTCAISRKPAPEIANEAKKFGQQDDITVLTVERTAIPVPAI